MGMDGNGWEWDDEFSITIHHHPSNPLSLSTSELMMFFLFLSCHDFSNKNDIYGYFMDK